jgi:hypothetical protein
MTDFDIHERTRIRIHVISGKVAPVEASLQARSK